MTIQSRLQWCGHVMRGDINSQMCEVMEVEKIGKRKKGRPRKITDVSVVVLVPHSFNNQHNV